MADDTHISWRRWRSFQVYLRCTFVSGVLTAFGCCWSLTDLGPIPAGGLRASEYYLCVVMSPVMLTKGVNATLANVLFLLNPFIYGGMWWFAWRMWTLMSRKRPE